nr:MAG TPA: hypothetical protein [Caudoviricetes sp.]
MGATLKTACCGMCRRLWSMPAQSSVWVSTFRVNGEM